MEALEVDLFDEPFGPARSGALAPRSGPARQGSTVVLENGFWTRAERETALHEARALGATVEMRYLEVPFGELIRRLEDRDEEPGEAQSTRPLWESYAALFEPPGATELATFDQSLD